MRKAIIPLVLLATTVWGVFHWLPPARQHSTTITVATGTVATLVKVVDGDTYDFDCSGSVVRVRLLGVDTPETVHEVQSFGVEASTFAKQCLVNAKEIRLQEDSVADDIDNYGRLLRHIVVDGKQLGALLLAKGLARVTSFQHSLRGQYYALYVRATSQRIGMWK